MAAASFESWLAEEVRKLNADEEVFVPYITGILEEDDDQETKAEALDGILEGISEDTAANAKLRDLILDEWKKSSSTSSASGQADGAAAVAAAAVEKLDLNAQLASITDHKTAAYAAARASASTEAPDKSVKEAILAQYAGAVEESSDEDEGGGGGGGGAKGGDGGGGCEMSNLNAESVAREEQEKREKSRQAAMAKKEKDKEDREKQKKQAEDRKKKAQEKAAKGERRR